MVKIIDGKAIASQLRVEIAQEVQKIKNQHNIIPSLAVILVGSDPASEVYVSNKEKAAHSVGMNSVQYKLAAETSEKELITKIHELNNDKNIHGILVQLPLPKHINQRLVIATIDPRKDVDGFHIINAGKLAVGEIDDALIPCTPLGSLHLIKSAIGNNLAGLKALVVGSSNIVGAPLARLLMLEKCTVIVANSSTKNLKEHALQSDIVIVATGVKNLLKADMVKPGAVIIDVGINRVDLGNGKSKLVGDVDFDAIKEIASAITPVPGGVGPMTIAYLLKNTLTCFKNLQD